MSTVNQQRKVRWGVLGAAAIAIKKVIPGMQKSEYSTITAIASRDLQKAKAAAAQCGVEKAYGTYEELLADPEIDAIYNPLPNHLHVSWSIRAAEAGKHVLCEKPVSMNVSEARELIAARDRTGVQIGEAFMVYSHPQWKRTHELVSTGAIGELRSIVGAFSYFNVDPDNIRNQADIGGGGLMDVGCYPITTSRWLFGKEPTRVSGLVEMDPVLKTDRLASAMLDFGSGQSVFNCSTQLVPYQRMQILGTKARVEIEIPFNAPPDKPTRIFVDDGAEPGGRKARMEEFGICDQYGLQGDDFVRAIRGESALPVTLENALGNMAVIEAVFRSAKSGKWEAPQR
jgi:predicted dehydrogenase